MIILGGALSEAASDADLAMQAVAASALAASFKHLTGVAIMVGPNQMRFFREAGVDCSNLMLYPQLLT